MKRSLLQRIGSHIERLLEISEGTYWRVQRCRPISSRTQGDAGLGRERIGLRPRWTGAVSSQIVARQHAGEVILS